MSLQVNFILFLVRIRLPLVHQFSILNILKSLLYIFYEEITKIYFFVLIFPKFGKQHYYSSKYFSTLFATYVIPVVKVITESFSCVYIALTQYFTSLGKNFIALECFGRITEFFER